MFADMMAFNFIIAHHSSSATTNSTNWNQFKIRPVLWHLLKPQLPSTSCIIPPHHWAIPHSKGWCRIAHHARDAACSRPGSWHCYTRTRIIELAAWMLPPVSFQLEIPLIPLPDLPAEWKVDGTWATFGKSLKLCLKQVHLLSMHLRNCGRQDSPLNLPAGQATHWWAAIAWPVLNWIATASSGGPWAASNAKAKGQG